MTILSASYETGLQLLVAAGSVGSSGVQSLAVADVVAPETKKADASKSSDALDSHSSADTIAALRTEASMARGPQAGVMAAVIAAMSEKAGFYQNDAATQNAASDANSKLSSKDLSDILLSGGSLISGVDDYKQTFQSYSLADYVKMMRDIAPAQQNDKELTQWALDGMPSVENAHGDAVMAALKYGKSALASWTPEQILDLVADNKKNEADMVDKANHIADALANGTLKVQKATEVEGLDYKETIIKTVAFANGEGGVRVQDGSYNGQFFKEHTNGNLIGIGNLGIYLSW